MNKVPVEDAAWIGSQLAQLSDEQLRDTFRAAGMAAEFFVEPGCESPDSIRR